MDLALLRRALALERLLPLFFVLIWSTGFIAAPLVAPHTEPLTFLLYRYLLTIAAFIAIATAVGAPAWDSPAPTQMPTAWLSSKKNKKTAQMVVIISVCVCLGFCCLLAACGGGSYYVCKKRKKTPGLQEPSAPPLEAIPVPRFFSLRKKQRAAAPPLDIPVAQPVGKI